VDAAVAWKCLVVRSSARFTLVRHIFASKASLVQGGAAPVALLRRMASRSRMYLCHTRCVCLICWVTAVCEGALVEVSHHIYVHTGQGLQAHLRVIFCVPSLSCSSCCFAETL
jgi:hypothetical protein